MSEQEQHQGAQVEEANQTGTSEAVAANVQPEVVAASDKVIEATEKPSEATPETVEQTGQVSDKPVGDEATKEESTEVNSEITDAKSDQRNALKEGEEVADKQEDKVAADTTETVSNGAQAKEADYSERAAESNGETVEKKEEQQAAVEESNGVHKRKAENGAEPVAAEDEKSPKKAKVVDEGDQAKVEETAA